MIIFGSVDRVGDQVIFRGRSQKQLTACWFRSWFHGGDQETLAGCATRVLCSTCMYKTY